MITVVPLASVSERLKTDLSSPRVLLTVLLVLVIAVITGALARRVLRRPAWVAAAVALPRQASCEPRSVNVTTVTRSPSSAVKVLWST